MALSFAALLVAGRPGSRAAWVALALAGGAGLLLLLGPAGGWPVWLLLETLVALALAWRGHAALTRTPLAAPA